MHKAASEADNMLNVLRDTEGELAALGTQEPANWALLSYDQKIQYLDTIKDGLQGTMNITQKLQDSNTQKQKMLGDLKNMGVDQGQQAVPGDPVAQASKRRGFNLRFAQADMAQMGVQPSLPATDGAMPPTPEQPMQPTPEQDQSPTAKVRQILDGILSDLQAQGMDDSQAASQATDQAYQKITSQINPNQNTVDPNSNAQGNTDQTVRDAVNSYYSSPDQNDKDSAASVLARTVFPQDTQDGAVDNGEVPAVQQEGVKVNVANCVKSANEIIKKLAQADAKKASAKRGFNLTKEAHVKNVTVFSPELAIKDEFYGGPMSENDLLERNKGWGLKLDGYYTANWEKVWRENVMDKYDPLYIERRFEIDRLPVPASNNYQLAPGEKRRITPPEYGNTEARLEANRTEMNKERGYAPSEPGKPFNWKKAQQEKKAQTVLPQSDIGGGNPLKPNKIQKQEWLCHACGNSLEVTDTNSPMDRCTACGALQNGKAIPGKFKTGPDQAKTTAPAGMVSGPIHASGTDVDKLASVHGGIFFDGEKFVVVAEKKKKKFDTYYEAEEFKMLVQDPSAAPAPKGKVPAGKQKNRLTPQQIAHQRQVATHADGLGIDG